MASVACTPADTALRPLDYGVILVAAIAVRLAFLRAFPHADGDWALYGDVARNILAGCGVAVTTPEGCRPHFGGNQLPLFPAFAALVWWLSAGSDTAIRLVQTLIGALATVWLAHAVGAFTRHRLMGLAAGLLQAVSPVQAFWAGHLLTETLTLAGTQWVLAELLLGHAQGRFRTVQVGLAMTFSVWMRLDGVLLAVPVAVSALLMRPRPQAIRGCILAGLIVCASLGAWTVRNVAVGISPVPIMGVLPDGTRGPRGYVAWVQTWVVTEHDRAVATFFGVHNYERIRIPESAYASAGERAEVQALLERLRQQVGRPFPPEIDQAFRALAERRAAAQSTAEKLSILMARAYDLARPWVWPPGRKDGSGAPAPPSLTDLYRFMVVAGCVIGIAIAVRTRQRAMVVLATLAVAFAVARHAFFVAIVGLETRYLVEIAPYLEALAATGVVFVASALGLVGPAFREGERRGG
jgi:hypothetical protein